MKLCYFASRKANVREIGTGRKKISSHPVTEWLLNIIYRRLLPHLHS